VNWRRELRTQETFHFMDNCGKKPHKENDDGGSLYSVELNVVEKPVRIEAALHRSYPPLEGLAPILGGLSAKSGSALSLLLIDEE
jgi:hypothetical protein